jgi:chromosome segregation protein
LRGFKSFASATTLNFEEGITAVVGPNGSGKSNVVDAIAWVMGEQGAKSLRGGKMDDVIFSGTTSRAPLGRAEVVLTIDNSDGALPIEYAEVTISRTLFRNGGSEYAINGNLARLLDVQELLSDSGIGREMHVIVGQGQLQQVLLSTPEGRRGFIEEAAGVLKHRKRKEKAERKLEATQANMLRLQDLTTELRRQLKPLARQADVARKAQTIQADLRDAKLRLLADDLKKMREAMDREVADETALKERQAIVEAEIAKHKTREAELEVLLSQANPKLSNAQADWFNLASLRERFLGSRSLASERAKLAEEDEQDQVSALDPEALEAEAREVRKQANDLDVELNRVKNELAQITAQRESSETAFNKEQTRFQAAQQRAADFKDGITSLNSQIMAAKSRIEARDAETERLRLKIAEATDRAELAKQEYLSLEAKIAGLNTGEANLDSQYESVAKELAEKEKIVADLEMKMQEVSREKAGLIARAEALAQAAHEEIDAADELLASGDESLIGSLATLLRIEKGWETAIATGLGRAANAIAAKDSLTAIRAVEKLKRDDRGRATMLLADALGDQSAKPSVPDFARSALDVVSAPYELANALNVLLKEVVLVENLQDAQLAVRNHPRLLAVTRDGDAVSSSYIIGGSGRTTSKIEAKAKAEIAAVERDEIAKELDQVKFQLQGAKEDRNRTNEKVEAALSLLHASDAEMAAVAEKLGALGEQKRSAEAETKRLENFLEEIKLARLDDERVLNELENRLNNSEGAPSEMELDPTLRDELVKQAEEKRQLEIEAKLAVRTAEERHSAVLERAMQLERQAETERTARIRAQERREQRRRAAATASAVLIGIDTALSYLESSLAKAEIARDEAQKQQKQMDEELLEVRKSLRALGSDLDRLVDSVHRDEVARTEQRLRIEQMEDRALEDYGVDAETLQREYGPEQLVPVFEFLEEGEARDPQLPAAEPIAYVREQQEKRAQQAEKQLNLLGRVNPLALEEFAALEERNQFLTEQLEDVKKTRKDLLDVISEVEQRVQQIFLEAYRDVSREFEDIFPRLFPGGKGKIVLTDPHNLREAGVEVEASPAGKKVKRLTLLSGGEQSLAAVAFLVALFKARPSPFYILDEVEAALDDANLGRLLQIYEELREKSQLIIVTHQKRTMEIADALYGVSMRNDGVSAVVSQRIRDAREHEPV